MQQVLTRTANELGRVSGFVQRASKLTGAAFTQAWVFACLATPLPTCEALSQSAATCGVAITPQGFQQRCSKAAATLLERVLAAAVQQVIAAAPVAVPLLARFAGVFVQHSSTIALPAALADTWAGCGNATDQGTAALKVQVQLDLTHGTLDGPLLQAGRASDHTSPLKERPLVADALYLADLGYWSVARFASIAAGAAFWLSRYQPGTTLFTTDDVRWSDVVALLQAHGSATVDLPVTIGVQ